jgi:predicted alpha/beta-hydrolase family hydrolase
LVEPSARFEDVKIPLREPAGEVEAVSGVLGIPEWWPTGSRISIVLAHGQSGDLEDPQLVELQRALTEQKFLTLRFNFPFAEAKRKSPDPLPVLERTFRSAIAFLGRDPTAAPAHLFIGGKNLGAMVAGYLATGRARVDGLLFLGFPLHTQDKPERTRTDSLFRIISPMLFIQGNRDRLCDLPTLRRTLLRVGAPTTLHVVKEADHGFRVAKKSGRTPEEVNREILLVLESWIGKILGE